MADIRRATESDLDTLVVLGRAMHEESPRFNRYGFQPERLRENLATIMAMKLGLILVAESDGKLVGVMVALANYHYACDFIQACDLALFVYPEHRGGTAGARLVKSYVQWAQNIGAEPTIGINTGVEVERSGKLLAALGAKNSGTNWTWGI
jgi:GNAT superfamily N-acetyltransferase